MCIKAPSKCIKGIIKVHQSSSKHFKALQFSKLHFDRLWCARPGNDGFPNKRRLYCKLIAWTFFVEMWTLSSRMAGLQREHFHWRSGNFMQPLHHHYGQPYTDYVHMHVEQTTAAPWPLLKKQWIIESIEFIWVKQTYWVFVTRIRKKTSPQMVNTRANNVSTRSIICKLTWTSALACREHDSSQKVIDCELSRSRVCNCVVPVFSTRKLLES